MSFPASPPPSSPTPGRQPGASPQVQAPTGLYDRPQEALKSILDGYNYWTSKLTESSFALSLAVIGANWAVFGSVDKILNNICAEISIAAVISNLVISLLGSGWLGLLLRRRIAYAEENVPRWEKQFDDNKGKSTYWPSSRTIDWSAFALQAAKILLPVIGGVFFLIALFSQPKPQKDESHFGSSASPTSAALSSPSATAPVLGTQAPSAAVREIEARPSPKRELDAADSAKIRQWVENAHKRGEEWAKESPKPSPSVTEARQLQSQPKTPK